MGDDVGRRAFLQGAAALLLGGAAGASGVAAESAERSVMQSTTRHLRLFLCGDVMTARGIDQILRHSVDPALHEPYATSALDYVQLAEHAHGTIQRPVDDAYIWGDALAEWARFAADVRLANLETALTARGDWQRDKGIHYRTHPGNVGVLQAAGIDCCALANNHVLDWGQAGLEDTLHTLQRAGIRAVGAGRDLASAAAPALLPTKAGGVRVHAFGTRSSGIPDAWAAQAGRAGINLLPDLSAETLERVAARIKAERRAGEIVVASIHWGGNWGYAVPAAHRAFARGLVERGVDVVHGHSSHHPLGIEIHRGRPILYGCGDFINDYEGIAGYESYRGDLSLMYFVDLDPRNGELQRLVMVPMQMRRFRLRRASAEDARWFGDVLSREGKDLGTAVEVGPDGDLVLRWQRAAASR
jgi:poly-gamma-glutamate synthesis protein (capsule biosynthesis protein)